MVIQNLILLSILSRIAIFHLKQVSLLQFDKDSKDTIKCYTISLINLTLYKLNFFTHFYPKMV